MALGRMLVVAEVVSEFALESALDEGFGQLLEEAVLAEQIIGAVTIFEKFVNEFRLNGHLDFSFHERIRLRLPCTQNYL